MAKRAVKSVKVHANGVVSKYRHSKHSPGHVSKFFNCSVPKAIEILDKTTQQGIRQAVHPIERRYRVLRDVNRRRLDGRWGMDHILSNTKSIRQNNGGFVISNGEFTRTYPTPSKDGTDAGISLQTFCDDIGVPVNLKTDLASSFAGKKTHFQDVVYKNRIKLTHAEAGRKNELYNADT